MCGERSRGLSQRGEAPRCRTDGSSHLYPATEASPQLTSVSPVSILKVVVFPAPFTPNRPKHCPRNKQLDSLTHHTRPCVLVNHSYTVRVQIKMERNVFDFTSPGETPTQIRSTAAFFLRVYVCAEDTIIHYSFQHQENE